MKIDVLERVTTAFKGLQEKLGLTNVMQSPRLEKVVVSVGYGKVEDKNKIKLIGDRLTKITGQRPVVRGAKTSVASFKLREGQPIGYQVTLRGSRMNDFLNKLLNIALPRTKDFRGVPVTAIDEMGNYTFGIKDHTIFPETSDEDISNIFGMSVTVVTTARGKEAAQAFFEHIGFPFKK